MTSITFFNNKGGVGKTSLVYHLSWMFSELGLKVVAADLDPQANLTSMFLREQRLEEIWSSGKQHPLTIQGVVEPMLRGLGDAKPPHLETISSRISLIPGDLALSTFEDKLSEAWPRCHNRDEAAFRTMSAFYRTALTAARATEADVVLMDVGPNLGAINRAALISSEYVVIPLASDLFSLQGLRNLGPQLRIWRESWRDVKSKNPDVDLPLPSGAMSPVGYVVLQHATREDRPVKAYLRWLNKIPNEYRESVLGAAAQFNDNGSPDPHCLALLKHYRSLMPLAMEAHKPMFFLKPADGAIGAHVEAVKDCFNDFKKLANRIAVACGLKVQERIGLLPF